jgi:prolyl 4-hydroxylase
VNFIGEYQISDKAVDQLLEYWHNNKDKAEKGYVGNREYREKVKKSLEIMIEPRNLKDFLYQEELLNCLKKYISEYKYADEVDFYGITELIKIQYYDKGWGFYKWHSENLGKPITIKRHLVFSTYLNDVENGGTEFFYQDYTTKAKKGSTIIFPAIWTHTHRGQISQDQEKYIITGWFNFL